MANEDTFRPSVVWDLTQSCMDLPIVAFTPLALSVLWHTGWGNQIWDEAYEAGLTNVREDVPYTVPENQQDLMIGLARQVVISEQEVKDSLTTANQDHRRTAISAFMTRSEVRPTYTWSRIIMLFKILDLVLLPGRYSLDGGRDMQRPQRLHLPAWKAKGAITAFLDSLNEWPNTLREFLSKWKDREGKSQSEERLSTEDPDRHATMGRKEILRELMNVTKEHNTRAKLGYVENAFVSAALGLLACTLPHSLGNSLGERLTEITGVKSGEFLKQTDLDLLRPLYIASAISPICLLKGSQISKAHVRVCMYECVECMRTARLSNDDRRYRLECELVQLIMAIAVEGHRAYEVGMNKLMSTWADSVFTEDSFCTTYQARMESISFKEVQSRNPLTLRVSMLLKDAANRGRKEMHFSQSWVSALVDGQRELGKQLQAMEANANVEFNSTGLTGEEQMRERSAGREASAQEEVDHAGSSETMNGDPRTSPLHDVEGAQQPGNEDADVIQIQEKDRKRKRGNRSPSKADYSAVKRKKKRKVHRPPAAMAITDDETPSKYKQMAPQNNSVHLETTKMTFAVFLPIIQPSEQEAVVKRIYDYELKEITINRWSSLGEEMQDLEQVVSNCLKPGDEKFCSFVKEYTFKDWDRITSETKRSIFTHSCVVVHDGPGIPLYEIDDFNSPDLDNLLDLDDVREFQDQSIPIKNNVKERMCQSTIRRFIEEIGSNRVNLFLDIPIFNQIMIPTKELDDGRIFATRDNRSFAWDTPPHDFPSYWALIATESVTSTCHIDAGGLATYVQCLIGEKLWFIAGGDWDNVPNDEVGWDVSKMSFQCVHLKPGSRLYMRPGQPHFVVSLNDCLAVGGHFYSSTNYAGTLRSLVTERYAGLLVTNTEHTTSPIVLFKLLDVHSQAWSSYPQQSLPWRFPSKPELAALLIIGEYMDELDPELPEEKEGETWQCTRNFQRDHERVRKLLKNLRRNRCGGKDDVLDKELPKMLRIFEEYVTNLEAHTQREDRRLRRRRRTVC